MYATAIAWDGSASFLKIVYFGAWLTQKQIPESVNGNEKSFLTLLGTKQCLINY